MLSVSLGKPCVDYPDLLTVDGRGVAMVVACSEMLTVKVLVDAEHLGVFISHPMRTRTRWSCKHNSAAVCVDLVDYLIKEGEIEFALPRLKHSPRKDADGKLVDICLRHQLHVLVPYRLIVQPLLGVVVSAVYHVRKAGIYIFVFHFRYLLFGSTVLYHFSPVLSTAGGKIRVDFYCV